MRRISVDIFWCKRSDTKQAINQYLDDIKRFDGMQCPSVIMLGDALISDSSIDYVNMPVYRLFSVQRAKLGSKYSECKVVVNTSSKVNKA